MPKDLDRFGRDFSSDRTAASAVARSFAISLERTLATLDTSRYEAVEVIQPVAIPGTSIGGPPEIRLVESGEPGAEELAEQGYFDSPIARVVRYEAEDIDALRTYVDEGEQRDVERFVAEHFDVGDHDVATVAERLISSLEKHADERGEA